MSEYHSYCPFSPHKTMDYSQIYLNLLTTNGILHKETSYFLNSFLAYKNAINRNQKLGIFPKGQPVVLIKTLTFSLSFFFLKLSPNLLFDLVLEKKQPFVDDKNDIKVENFAFFQRG